MNWPGGFAGLFFGLRDVKASFRPKFPVSAVAPAAVRGRNFATAPSFSDNMAELLRGRPSFLPSKDADAMRSILLALLGVPLPIILLLAFCTHHF